MKADARQHTQISIPLNGLSGRVIGCAFIVLNPPGTGLLDKVDENALARDVRQASLGVALQYHCL